MSLEVIAQNTYTFIETVGHGSLCHTADGASDKYVGSFHLFAEGAS